METLSLSGHHIKDDTIDSEEVSKANISSSSSSSSSSSFDQDFLGFFSEDWSRDTSYDTSPENFNFGAKVVSSKTSIAGIRKTETKSRTSPLYFRSSSDSFRFMRLKRASKPSTPRSKSLPNRLPASSSSKSKWQMFMFGFRSGKFPTKMDMSDMKSRQLRRQSTVTVSQWIDDGKDERVGRRSEIKGWWWLVDVLGCSGGY